jgi:hypothetical protein
MYFNTTAVLAQCYEQPDIWYWSVVTEDLEPTFGFSNINLYSFFIYLYR